MISEAKLLERFSRYVQIDSESGSEGNICAALMQDLRGMGLSPIRDHTGEIIGSNGGNIYCYIPGQLSGKPLLLAAHVDTVCPGRGIRPVLGDRFISSGGDTVLGGDDKSGVALIMETVDFVRRMGLPHRSVEILFTISEEVGLKGSQHMDYSLLRSKQAVVMDSQGGFGDIKVRAPGKNKLIFEVHGRAAHAGAAPEDGICAISVAARAISQMRLLRVDEETTANIGSFIAKGATNVVNDYARLEAEVRSFSLEKLSAQCEHMRNCIHTASEEFGAKYDYELQEGARPYHILETHPLVSEIAAVCQKLGIPSRTFGDGGASDANNLVLHGIAAVALGCGMDKVHSTQETLDRKLFFQAAQGLAALLTKDSRDLPVIQSKGGSGID